MAKTYSINEQVQVLNRHDAEGFAGYYAPDAVVHDPQYTEPLRGTAIAKDFTDFLMAFPDLHFRLKTVVESGNMVAFEGTGEGTHKGPMVGPDGEIPPTNRPMEMRLAAFLRLNDQGKIVEERRYYDLAGLMRQLGLSS